MTKEEQKLMDEMTDGDWRKFYPKELLKNGVNLNDVYYVDERKKFMKEHEDHIVMFFEKIGYNNKRAIRLANELWDFLDQKITEEGLKKMKKDSPPLDSSDEYEED